MTDAHTNPTLVDLDEATAKLPLPKGMGDPITVIGNKAIRATFDAGCFRQAINARTAPGVTDLVINPDAHIGYGAPVGCAMASPTHIYPGPVGVDIKCSMSLLQLDLEAEAVEDRAVRRALIDAIGQRLPSGTGKGQRSVPKSRRVNVDLGRRVAIEGASAAVLEELGVPTEWRDRCEDAFHVGHDGTEEVLAERFDRLIADGRFPRFDRKAEQLGSYGGGNHFGECEVVVVDPSQTAVAEVFGLRDGAVAFLSHCGSRGFGHDLASGQFRAIQSHFDRWSISFPGDDRQLCYAPLGTPEADAYLDDMAMGANFATVNHMLINALVLEAFDEVIPGTVGRLVYFISHNIARREIIDNRPTWVMRKGATRAYPGGHHAIKDTLFAETGHPILLPGDPHRGSAVMVAKPGAKKSMYSVNHGAGRVLGRRAAIRALDQQAVDRAFDEKDVLTNCRNYPKDEAPDAYKDFNEVLSSVKLAGLADEVARLHARFVIKDAAKADD